MKRTIVLFLSLLIADQASAKRIIASPAAPQYRYAVKVYNSFGVQSTNNLTPPFVSPLYRTTSKDLTFLKPSVAFMWTDKKGHTREIELSSFSLNRRDDRTAFGTTTIGGQVATSSDISLRVERIFNFAKRKEWRLKPSLGIGVNPYFNMEKRSPYTSAVFPVSAQSYGIKAYVAPRINYNVSSRFFIDLNIPLVIANMDMQYQKMYDPGFPKPVSSGVANFDLFSTLPSIRLGVGLRL